MLKYYNFNNTSIKLCCFIFTNNCLDLYIWDLKTIDSKGENLITKKVECK